jgi:hypothetical protein
VTSRPAATSPSPARSLPHLRRGAVASCVVPVVGEVCPPYRLPLLLAALGHGPGPPPHLHLDRARGATIRAAEGGA